MKTTKFTTLLLGVTALSTAACSGDDDTCDTQSAGAICTIIGSGENGYDRNADNEVLGAREALPDRFATERSAASVEAPS